ncbi:MAG TPA: exonuclease SbcCD subunit D C-terminal domain-containing protein [Streptosporangiaceae bacterium]|jgi:exonuclease SbcD|nr:exonuclease SbcCD subunit D C-terminal domain-containing protein [Streptosporangiaceae bacterium]
MRLLHTSDWHLGRALHGESLLEPQAVFLDWLLAQAISQQADAVVVAGDVYDRAVPPLDAVRLLDRTLTAFAGAGIPMLITSGNHDSAVRLGFGSGLSEAAGIHLRTSPADLARPLVLTDRAGELAVYGIPYLLPDAVMAELGAARSHESVLAAASALIHADAAERGIGRVVIAAHAFVTGGEDAVPESSDSERDIRVGGVAHAPASVFGPACYVALGHLHGQQLVGTRAGDGGTVRYCGSPLAFSFSESGHRKSVSMVDIGADGQVLVTPLATPVPRALREVRGPLDELLARPDGDGLMQAWVKAVLTDAVRPAAPMERLREKWPHTIALDFQPEGGLVSAEADLSRLARATDPVEICGLFVEYAGGGPPDAAERQVLADAVEAACHAEDPDVAGAAA